MDYITIEKPEHEELLKQIETLKKENEALNRQVKLMYSNWNFDYKRFEELKAKCKIKSVDDCTDKLLAEMKEKNKDYKVNIIWEDSD